MLQQLPNRHIMRTETIFENQDFQGFIGSSKTDPNPVFIQSLTWPEHQLLSMELRQETFEAEYLSVCDEGSLNGNDTNDGSPGAAPAGTIHVSEPPAARPARCRENVKPPKTHEAADEAAHARTPKKTD